MLPVLKQALHALYFNNASLTNLLHRWRAGSGGIGHKHDATHQALARREQAIRSSLKDRPRPISVVFLVTENAKWNVQSVYDALAASPAFEPLVLTFPGPHKPRAEVAELVASEQRNLAFFRDRQMRVRSGFTAEQCYLDLHKLAPDVVFYEQPHQFLPDSLWVHQVKHFALTCYVGYGIMVAGIQQLQFNRAFHHDMWRIFAETEHHKELFSTYSLLGHRNVEVSGHPKLDVYLGRPPDDGDSLWSVPRDSAGDVKRVIWAPHFSIKNREVAFSTFHRYYNTFLDLARRDMRLDWIIKPHPWLRLSCVKYGLMSHQEVDDYFRAWEALPNARLCEEDDYFDLFKTSDAMILDSVSFVAEYMPTAKPMLFLVNREPPLVGFNEFGDSLQAGLYRARCEADVHTFIEGTLFGGEDPLAERRRDLAARLLVQPTGGAGAAIRDHLLERLLP
jgi:hypothetical protein